MRISVVFVLLINLFVSVAFAINPSDSLLFEYKLHGQTRKFKFRFVSEEDGSVVLNWSIERNLKMWKGAYTMRSESVDAGNSLSFVMPEDGNYITLADNETFAMISRTALRNLKDNGQFVYDAFTYRKISEESDPVWGAVIAAEDEEGARLKILDNDIYPIILKMENNSLEIDWIAHPNN